MPRFHCPLCRISATAPYETVVCPRCRQPMKWLGDDDRSQTELLARDVRQAWARYRQGIIAATWLQLIFLIGPPLFFILLLVVAWLLGWITTAGR